MGCFFSKPKVKETPIRNSPVPVNSKPVAPPPAPSLRKLERPKAYGAEGYELVSDFKVGEQGQLKILRNKKTKEEVLAKFVEISSNEGIPRDLEREIVNHRQLLHPNIVRFYEVFVLEDSLAIISEYPPGGVLNEVIRENGPVTEAQAKSLYLTMLAGMEYCHRQQIYHRDLRPENMHLVNLEGAAALKLSGFGYSKHAVFDGAPETRGTHAPLNIPPELLMGGGQQAAYDGSKLDIWQSAIALYFMLTGFHPLEDRDSPGELNRVVMNRIVNCQIEIPDELSPECADFLKKIFVPVPANRPTIQQLRQSPWLTGTKLSEPAVEVTPSNQTVTEIEEVVERARQRRAGIARKDTARMGAQQRHPSNMMPTRYSPADRNPRTAGSEYRIAELPSDMNTSPAGLNA